MATNPNLNFPSYDDWVSGGTYQTGDGKKLDPNDKNMPGYYTNYINTVTGLINSGKLAHAKETVKTHGQKWTAPAVNTNTNTNTNTVAVNTNTSPGPSNVVTTAAAPAVTAPAVEAPVLEAFDMAKLTDNMDLSNKLTEIINTNSPLFKAAQTKAMQNMQRRGLVNSTLAQEAVMNSVINVALPIAQAEVNQLVTNLYYNTDWTNKQKMQANEAAYNKMLTQIQGRINFTLQELTGSQNIGLQNLKGQQAMDLQSLVGQQETALQQQKTKADLWAKYGDWVTMMATTEGADQEAWQNMLDMLTGAGGWPSPT